MLVYTKNIDGKIIHSDMNELMTAVMVKYLGSAMSGLAESSSQMNSMSSMLGMGRAGTWQEMLPGLDGEVINPIIKKQYDLVYGRWAENYDEVVLVLDHNNEIADMTLYALGLKSEDDINSIAEAAVNHESIEYSTESWSYEDICGTEYRVILNPDCYQKDESTGLFTDLRESNAGLKYLYDNALTLKVVGIIRPNEDAVSAMLTGTICYTSELTDYVIENAKNSEAIKAQLNDSSTDIFTGLEFRDSDSKSESGKAEYFRSHVESLDESDKADMYRALMSIPTDEVLDAQVAQVVAPMSRADMELMIIGAMAAQTGMSEETIKSYIAAMSDDELTGYISESVAEQVRAQYAAGVAAKLAEVPASQQAALLDAKLAESDDAECAKYYEELLTFSDSSYDENLKRLGYIELDKPASINLYASGFEDKDTIVDAIAGYNEAADDIEKITYTDYVGIMMSSVTTIINAITYVLIAFVAVSLIVSSIMIGVITLISVQERTKEIGILRAIGASKRNVSGMFNAETVIIGFTSGLLGVLITYLLCIPINLILHHLTGINNLSAYLPPAAAVILVAISVLLTLIAGIIPSRSAAKKDPVVALRSE